MKNMMYINGQDSYDTYGLVMRKGCDDELLKPPVKKEGHAYDWGDENGIETDPDETPVFERKTYNLPLTLMADDYSDFATKYTEFVNFLLTAKEFNLDILHLNRRFKVRYQSVTSFDKLTTFHSGGKIGCALWLQLTDDYPTEIFRRGVPAPPALQEISLNSSDHPMLQWVEGDLGDSPKLGNKIQRRMLGGDFADIVELTGSQTSYTDTNVAENVSYEYRVATRNSTGYSSWSNVKLIDRTPVERGVVTNVTYSSVYGSGQNFGYKQYVPGGYNYNSQDYPLVIWLHGLGERSQSNGNPQFSRLELYGPFKEIKDFDKDYPFLMIAPQQPTDVDGKYTGRSSWDESIIEESLQHFKNQGYRVDLNRVYVTGQSMGGGGVFNYLSTYGDTIAAALPIASTIPKGLSVACDSGIKNTPIWAFHAEGDPQVPSSNTKNMVNAINLCSPAPPVPPKITIFNLSSHTGWNQVYKETGASLTSYPDNTPYPDDGLVWWDWLLQYTLGGQATVPGKVTGLAITTISSTQLRVDWYSPASGGSPIIGYKIERRLSGGSWLTIVANSGSTNTTYLDNGLSNATVYEYRVSAINTIGVGAASDVSSGTTGAAASVPAAPSGLTAAAQDWNTILLQWITPANGGSAITGYKIERKSNAGYATIVSNTGSAQTSYQDSTVDGGTSYTYRVSAINAIGTGPNSAEATVTTPPMPDFGNLIKINFGGSVGSAHPSPVLDGIDSTWFTIWHDITRNGGASFSLKNAEGVTLPYTLHAENVENYGWGVVSGNASGDAGYVTGNNSGTVPDNVAKFYWFTNKNSGNPNGGIIRVSGLTPNEKWTIKIFASRDTNDNRLSGAEINETYKEVLAGNNSENWMDFQNVEVNAGGEIIIRITGGSGFQYGYLNALIMSLQDSQSLAKPSLAADTISPGVNKITVN